jgi:hypothetical protein
VNSSSTPRPPTDRARYLAAVAVGVAGIAAGAALTRSTELVTGRYLSAGVPPILAIALLLLLIALRPLARRLHPALAVDRQQALVVYAMMTVGIFVCGQYAVRAFLPHLLTLAYWGGRQPVLAKFRPLLPGWFAPADPAAARGYFEGGARVPWREWCGPLFVWSLFFLAIFLAALSLVSLFRRHWIRNERLSFPLLYLPLAISAEGERGIGPLFRQRLTWLGVGIAAAFNGINILHVLIPAVPAPGFYYSFAGQFPDPPWVPLNSVMLFFMLEAIGFGYFFALEVSFSAWFFYLVEKGIAVGGLAGGYDRPGFPFIQEQSAGAYLAMGLLLIWGGRRALTAPFRRKEPDREGRLAYAGLIASCAALAGWCWFAGFDLRVAGAYFGMILCFVLVYARLRAETGVPFEFIYPYGLPKELLVNAAGPSTLLRAAGPRTWVILSSIAWLSRHHYAEAMGAYQIDSLKLSETAAIARRRIIGALLIALLFGLACAFWIHLHAFYALGSNVAGGGGGAGEYRATVALQEFQVMASRAAAPPPQDAARLVATGAGFGFALALGLLRGALARFPLHPLGFILATAYGDHTTIFFPMFAAWLIKAAVLRAGGLRLYRRLITLFLGLIVGHYLIGGLLWPILSLLLAPEASRSYHLYFGG